MALRTLVIGDIHGGLQALLQVLERATVTENDSLIFLGDYVDGWSESPELIDYLIDLAKKQPCVFIRGNHDELLLQWLDKSADNKEWYKHGGEATVLAYSKTTVATRNRHIEFLKNLQNYHLDDQNRLFVHAGFTNLHGVAFEYYPRLFYWDRTLWETAISFNNAIDYDSIYYPRRFKKYHEIYIGHTPVTQIFETEPQQRANIWNIDTGAAFKGKLSILDIDTKMFWQSDALPSLYPNEKGRN